MMVVKVEIWPHGEVGERFEIARVGIINQGTGTPAMADYHVVALNERDCDEKILQGQVLDHRRALPWQRLVSDALYAMGNVTIGERYAQGIAELLREG